MGSIDLVRYSSRETNPEKDRAAERSTPSEAVRLDLKLDMALTGGGEGMHGLEASVSDASLSKASVGERGKRGWSRRQSSLIEDDSSFCFLGVPRREREIVPGVEKPLFEGDEP